MRTRRYMLSVLLMIFILPCVVFSQTDETIYATFDGGSITRKDLKAYIDSITLVFSTPGVVDDHREVFEDKEQIIELLKRLSFNRIGASFITDDDFTSFPVARANYAYTTQKAAYQYLLMEYCVPELLRRKQAYEDQLVKYYNEKKEDEFKKPDNVAFQIIFFNLKDIEDEKAIAEKHEKAQIVYEKLEKDYSTFLDLANEYSEVDFKDKGKLIGPYPIDRLDAALGAAIEDLEPGDITPVVKTKHGLTIARLQERTPEFFLFDEVKEKIVESMARFNGASVERTFFNSLIGDTGVNSVLYGDAISTDTADLNEIVAEYKAVTLTNSEIYPLFLDMRFLDFMRDKLWDDIQKEIIPLMYRKCIAVFAEDKGLLDNPRYETMKLVAEEAYKGDMFKEKITLGLMNDRFPKDSFKNLPDDILNKFNFKIVQYPDVKEFYN